jgi:hypothetical protein
MPVPGVTVTGNRGPQTEAREAGAGGFFSAKTEKTMPEEVFFLFIALCIGLWLIQLATEWIDRHRIKRGTVMKRYRGHLILVKAHQEPDTDEQAFTFSSMNAP